MVAAATPAALLTAMREGWGSGSASSRARDGREGGRRGSAGRLLMLVFAASKRRPKDGGRAPLEIWALAVVFTALGAAVRLPATLAPRTACLAPSAREVVTEAMVTWGRECDSGRGATRRRAFANRQLVILAIFSHLQEICASSAIEESQTVARDAFSPDASIFETHVPSGRTTR